ncbi:MAG: glycosyltransferase family 2 protein [Firmicutes bacterium]|nr:glycosyltransferase family 2 protein [Bacillota bacterium]
MEVAAIIPAYNESCSIGDTVRALKNIPGVTDILVVDDGSKDNTAAIACREGARVLRLPINRGKGYAVCRGWQMVTAPLVALVDADLGCSAQEIWRLVEPVRGREADMAVAVFPRCRRGGWGLVKRLASWAIRRTTGQVLSEPLSGQRVLRRELVGLLRYAPRGFGLEMGLALDLLSRGCNILEVKTAMAHRERGKDPASIWHRLKQLLAILREIYLRRELL